MDHLPDCAVSLIISYGLSQHGLYLPLNRYWRALGVKSYSRHLATLYKKKLDYIFKWVCDIDAFMSNGIVAWTRDDIFLHRHLFLNILVFRGEYELVFQLIQTYNLNRYGCLMYITLSKDDSCHCGSNYIEFRMDGCKSKATFNYLNITHNEHCPGVISISTEMHTSFLGTVAQIAAIQGHFATLDWCLNRFEARNGVFQIKTVCELLNTLIRRGHRKYVFYTTQKETLLYKVNYSVLPEAMAARVISLLIKNVKPDDIPPEWIYKIICYALQCENGEIITYVSSRFDMPEIDIESLYIGFKEHDGSLDFIRILYDNRWLGTEGIINFINYSIEKKGLELCVIQQVMELIPIDDKLYSKMIENVFFNYCTYLTYNEICKIVKSPLFLKNININTIIKTFDDPTWRSHYGDEYINYDSLWYEEGQIKKEVFNAFNINLTSYLSYYAEQKTYPLFSIYWFLCNYVSTSPSPWSLASPPAPPSAFSLHHILIKYYDCLNNMLCAWCTWRTNPNPIIMFRIREICKILALPPHVYKLYNHRLLKKCIASKPKHYTAIIGANMWFEELITAILNFGKYTNAEIASVLCN